MNLARINLIWSFENAEVTLPSSFLIGSCSIEAERSAVVQVLAVIPEALYNPVTAGWAQKHRSIALLKFITDDAHVLRRRRVQIAVCTKICLQAKRDSNFFWKFSILNSRRRST